MALAVACAGLLVGPGRAIRPAAADTVHSVADFAADPFPGRRDHFNATAATGTRRLLVILVRFADPPAGADYSAYTPADLARLVFGPTGRNVGGYFDAASGGRFSVVPVAEHDGAADGVVTLDGESYADWVDLHDSAPRIRHAVEVATASLDAADLDLDGDGAIEESEFTALVVVGDASRDAVTLAAGIDAVSVDGLAFPAGRSVIAGGVRIEPMTYAHELSHVFFSHADLYGYGIGTWDVMGPTIGLGADSWFLPSAMTRLELGWLTPQIARSDGWFDLRRVDRGGGAVLIHDPDRGVRDFFLLEYRGRGSALDGYDSAVPDDGLVIERVQLESSWTDVRESNPIIEIVAPDGLPRSPGCAVRADLAVAAPAGSTSFTMVNASEFGPTPFTAFIDDPALVGDEEMIAVTGETPSTRTITLAGPTTRAHGLGTKVAWRMSPFGGSTAFAVTAAGAPAAIDATALTVGRVTGTLPASFPFTASVEIAGAAHWFDVTAIDGSTWTVEGLDAAVPKDARIVVEERGRCRSGSDVDAWAPGDDARTPTDATVLRWRDGTSAHAAVRSIERSGDRYRFFVDLLGPGVRVEAPPYRTFREGVSDYEARVTNTGEATAAYLVTAVDGAGRRWGLATRRIRGGAAAVVRFRITNDLNSRGPAGGRLTARAEMLGDSSVADQSSTTVGWFVPDCLDTRAEPCAYPVLRRVRGLDPRVLDDGATRVPRATSTWRAEGSLRQGVEVALDIPAPSATIDLPLVDDAGHPIDVATIPRCGIVDGVTRSGIAGPERLRVVTSLEVDVTPEDATSFASFFVERIGTTSYYADHHRFGCDEAAVSPRELAFGGVGRYDVEVTYEVTLRWEPAQSSFLADVLESASGGGIPCRGGGLPRCDLVRSAQGNDPLIGTLDVTTPAAGGVCIDDACPTWLPVAWPANGDLDLAVSLPPGARLTLRDAAGDLVGTGSIAGAVPVMAPAASTTVAAPNPAAASAITYIADVPVESRFLEETPGQGAHDRFTIGMQPASRTILFIPPAPTGPLLERLRLDVPELPAGDYVVGIELPAGTGDPPEGGYPVEWNARDDDLDGIPDLIDDVVFAVDSIRARVYDANGGWQLVADGGLVDGRVTVSKDAKGRPRLTAVGHVAGPDQRLITVRAVLRRGPTGWTGRASLAEAKGRAWLGEVSPQVTVVDGRTIRVAFPEAMSSRGGSAGPLTMEFRDVVP